MKKIILLLMILLPLAAMAQKTKIDKHAPKYLTGAVPTENGIVTFKKTFRVPGQSNEQLYNNMLFYVKDNLVVKGIEDAWTRMLTEDKNNGIICARVEEWMVFSKKFLSLDQTRFRYQINVKIDQGSVNIELTQISYLYGEEWIENKPAGEGGTIYRAEEWITDERALNGKGTKVLPASGKFRRSTIDRAQEIFDNAMDMFEEQAKAAEVKTQETKVQKRQFVVE
ncbi:MAG: DUF4468 domain-containing protein [Bacteroidaceae bacterium]|nr:DUF4468 domain-containing protein [Bacteroidaceae bacterium]